MNGIDAVAIATGNDWRAIEAAAHAYASRGGRYKSLTRWYKDEDGNLIGELDVPLKVGTVGGSLESNPAVRIAYDILGVSSARELAAVMGAVGLAQNFSAIRALSTTGIQAGHMTLHARSVAMTAGLRLSILRRSSTDWSSPAKSKSGKHKKLSLSSVRNRQLLTRRFERALKAEATVR